MRLRYSVDNANRLIIRRNRKRLVTHGRFTTDKNQLVYWLNEPPAWRRLNSIPPKVSFSGNWRLSPNYDLEFKLDKNNRQGQGQFLVLKGEIISVGGDNLLFETKTYDKQGLLHIQTLKLTGFWQADELNHLVFTVEKKASPDRLIFGGTWQVNRNQQISYAYEKTNLKTKSKSLNTLTFTGFWQINDINRLTYILSQGFLSKFDFRAQIESPNLYPQRGVIKYRLGVGLKEKRIEKAKIISFYGAWKFGRNLGLIFQMNYGQGKIQTLEFGTEVSLSKNNEAVFSLTNKEGEPLGFNVIFTRRFLKRLDAEAFLRIKKLERESGLEAGVKIPF